MGSDGTVVLLNRQNLVGTRRVYDGQIVNLRVDNLQHPQGHIFKREVVEHSGGVVIACQPSARELVLIRQYRYPIDQELIELPAGRLEAGEEPLPAAQRELAEETGFQASHWEAIARLYSAPGFCNELLHFFRATGVSFVGKSLDEDEETQVLEISIDKAWDLVRQGRIQDAKTVAGIALLRNS